MLRKLIVDLLLPAIFLAMLALLLKWLIVPSSCDNANQERSVYGAPIPLPKAKLTPVSVRSVEAKHYAGTWKMVWGSSNWEVTLSSFGSYHCINKSDSTWVGNWHVDPAGNWGVTEKWVDENNQLGGQMQWTAEWTPDKRGNFDPTKLKGVVRRPNGTISPTSIIMVKIK